MVPGEQPVTPSEWAALGLSPDAGPEALDDAYRCGLGSIADRARVIACSYGRFDDARGAFGPGDLEVRPLDELERVVDEHRRRVARLAEVHGRLGHVGAALMECHHEQLSRRPVRLVASWFSYVLATAFVAPLVVYGLVMSWTAPRPDNLDHPHADEVALPATPRVTPHETPREPAAPPPERPVPSVPIDHRLRRHLEHGLSLFRSGQGTVAGPWLDLGARSFADARLFKLGRLFELASHAHVLEFDEIQAIGDELAQVTDPAWVDSGVVAFARKQRDRWASLEVQQGEVDRYVRSAREVLDLGNPSLVIAMLRGASERASSRWKASFSSLRMLAEDNLEAGELLERGRLELEAGHAVEARHCFRRIPKTSIYHRAAIEALGTISLSALLSQAHAWYREGNAEKALALLEDEPDDAIVDLRARIEQAAAICKRAQESGAPEAWETLRAWVADPENHYYKLAQAHLPFEWAAGLDRAAIAEGLAEDAGEKLSVNLVLEAAQVTGRALRYDPANAAALALRDSIVRDMDVRFAIERSTWERDGDAPEFVRSARHRYAVLRAASPEHPLLARIAACLRAAGGELPPADAPDPRDP